MTEVYDICMERITPEPWLRGTITGRHPVITQLLYSFQQTREDLEYFTDGLSADQLWSRPGGLASVGFHARHIAGSIDRLNQPHLAFLASGAVLAALGWGLIRRAGEDAAPRGRRNASAGGSG